MNTQVFVLDVELRVRRTCIPLLFSLARKRAQDVRRASAGSTLHGLVVQALRPHLSGLFLLGESSLNP